MISKNKKSNNINKGKLNPHVSIDCVIFGFDFEKLNVLTITRGVPGSKNIRMALPGDLIYDDEDLDSNANRILKELTGVNGIFLEQVGAFGNPNRIKTNEDQEWLQSIRQKPQARVVTIAYFALVPMTTFQLQASSFAQSVQWTPIEEIKTLAFDHLHILQSSFDRLKSNINTHPIGFNLLPEKFTMGQLHKLYEAILQKEIDKRNFRRKINKLNIVTKLSEKQKGVAHKPSGFVMFNESKYKELSKTGIDNFAF